MIATIPTWPEFLIAAARESLRERRRVMASSLAMQVREPVTTTIDARAVATIDARAVATIDARAAAADVRLATTGDGDAYARIVRAFQPLLTRRMARFSRDVDEIERLVQDVFVEAYFGLKNFRGDAPFEHWLQRIATRVGYRYWKTRARDKTRSGQDLERLTAPQSTMTWTANESIEQVRFALDALPPRDRLVLTLLYLDGHSVAEAAALSGWSQTMVKVQAFRARGKLRKAIEGAGGER